MEAFITRFDVHGQRGYVLVTAAMAVESVLFQIIWFVLWVKTLLFVVDIFKHCRWIN